MQNKYKCYPVNKILLGMLAAGMLCGTSFAAAPSHMDLLVGQAHSEADGGRLGGYAYDANTGNFWLATFGTAAGVRQYDSAADDSETYVTPTDIELFNRASDVSGGLTSANNSGNTYLFSMLLNPKEVTRNGVIYQAGELGVLINYSDVKEDGLTLRPEWGKAVMAYDLRKIGSATTKTPDRANAQTGAPDGSVYGATGVTDWNDAFGVIATNNDFTNASIDSDYEKRPYIARQFAWSSSGKSIYISNHGNREKGGGIYRLNVETNELNHVVTVGADSSSTYYAEPSVVHTSVRDFGAGEGAGDQVIISGAADNGNANGISYFVDGESGASDVKTLVSGEDLLAFTERDDTRLWASTADTEGNLYFVEGKGGNIFKLDQAGRLISIANKAQLSIFNKTNGGKYYSNSGNATRLQLREIDGGDLQLMTRTNNTFVTGVTIGKSGDLNQDGQINVADTNFFKTQYEQVDAASLIVGSDEYLHYISADLNGTADFDRKTGVLASHAVTNKDMDVLRQFINLRAGDTNWDFKVDISDFETLRSNFDPTATDKSWFDGNYNYNTNGAVDIADFEALRASFNPADSYETEVAVTSDVVTTQANTPVFAAAESEDLSIEITADGTVNLVGNASFTSFQIVGDADSVVESNFIPVAGMFETSGDKFVGGLGFAPVALDGRLSLGQIYNIDLDLRDLVFSYNGNLVGEVTYLIPEPSAVMMLMASSLLLLRRKQA
ncbi:hypothetical protein KS4_09020 [Poriferisphaera corsica]|uniref:PEP-CTERM protein-sorting domain-containing protein n=1 Tax=Poriferisphaera corsica TaxID=2528020 RepID=A0A517YRM1_9BACT|nr:hypothetical protein [Poriferisphaera corsica]QDU32864.1 hypothetical protein KS4_09020 [Poriferisphaera corsica]